MKKILYVATVVKMHIMEFHIPYLKMLKEMGWETAVAARNDYDISEDCVIPYCDTYYNVPFERSPVRTGNIKAYKTLKKIIDEGKFDIVHCHTPVGAMIARIAARGSRRTGTNVIYTAHGFHFFKGAPLINWLLYYPVEWICAWMTDTLITINKEDYALAIKRMHAKKIEYVPGVGIDLKKFSSVVLDSKKKRETLGIKKDGCVLLSVGELNENKNHSVVIRAIAKLNNPNIYYVICGQGKLINAHKKLAKDLGISSNVILTGYRTDVEEFYKMADIYVLPSLREGLNVSLMEAMTSGLPIICGRIRGNTDLIAEDKSGGILVTSDKEEEYIQAIESIVNNRIKGIEMGATNQRKMQEFSTDVVVKRVIEMYH